MLRMMFDSFWLGFFDALRLFADIVLAPLGVMREFVTRPLGEPHRRPGSRSQ